MSFCLPKEQTDKFIQALKDGVIDPAKLSEMSSAERNSFFEKIVGKDASEVNAQFEQKLLLKNQQAGMINWAKKLTGITEQAKTDIISKIGRMDKVLSAPDQQSFLQDLASKKLGTDVTFEEAQKITQLSKDIADTKQSIPQGSPDGSPERLNYGAKAVELQNYVNDLKSSNEVKTAGSYVKDLPGIAKGVKASLDLSALFRQGWKTIFTHPSTWVDNAIKSFSYLKQLGVKGTDNVVMDGVKAEIYSRDNAINGLQRMAKLDVGTGEEAYPTSLPEKIPLFGRLFKTSEVHYQAFLMRLRADVFDQYIDLAKKNGLDVTDKAQVQSIGKLVNSLTGRGDLGRLESAGKVINSTFFSPKMLKSSFDFLTAHQFQKDVTPFVRQQAAINLVKVASATAVILATAKAINPNSVELDPRSSDFGKIKVGNTRFDVTAGMGSLITLSSRVLSQSSKSSATGRVTPLNSGKYGSKTGGGVMWDFAQNKLAPAASVVNDVFGRGQTFKGEKPTVSNEAQNLLVPLPIQNIQELLTTPNAANVWVASILDSMGIVTNTYK